jgi:hypothetical protein
MAGNRVVLTFVGDTKDLERAFERVGASAMGMKALVGAALGPGLIPVAAAGTSAVVGLGAALSGAGAAAGVFAGVMKSSFGEVQEASTKTSDLKEKIRLLGEQIKVANSTGIGDAGKLAKAQVNAQNELLARYRLMPPALRQVTMSYDGMKSSWQDFVDKNKPATFGIMTGGFSLLTTIIPKLQPLFDVASGAVQKLLGYLSQAAGGGGVEKLVGWLTAQAGPALDNFIQIGRNVAVTIGNLFVGFAPTGKGFLDWLTTASGKMADWSKGNGLKDFIKYATDNGPGVVTALTNLATAAVNIAKAVGPLAPVSMAIATGLAALVAALPPEVITAMVAGWVAYSAALKIYYAWTTTVAASTKVWAAAQWVMNTALFASPITWIVLAVVALIAIIVLIATKTDWFQKIWKAAWGWVKKAAGNAWDFIKKIPGWIGDAFKKVANFISAPFKTAFNFIADAWNNTVGRLSFTFPSWVPGIGGNNISVPHIPKFHSGGVVGGAPGSEQLAILQAGEKVTPASGNNSGADITINSGGSKLDDLLVEVLAGAIKRRGGNVQAVLGFGRG